MPSKTRWNSKGKIVEAVAVTPSDSADNEYDALYIGGAGDVAVVHRDDTSAVTYISFPVGEFLPASVKKVMATNTSATNILGLTVETR